MLFFFLFAFLLESIFIFFPYEYSKTSLIRSKALKKRVEIKGNTIRTDYVDENGNITIAADVGYAIRISKKEGTCKEERFYDDKEKPISQYPGYYALLREYDADGQNYHISYLGIDNLPVMTVYGFSDVFLTFYDNGKIKTEKYYDPSCKPVCTYLYGYGLLNEYDESGNIIRITYQNEKDEPMMVGLGYAIVKKYYYLSGTGNGKVESEFYFDETEKPIALSLGQYGIHKEYNENGQESVLTYLDKEGNPIITTKGYTTVRKTYHADNYTATERYYDLEGNPYALSDSQYGIKRVNNEIVYLDKDGNEVFNVRRILYNQTWIIIPCSALIIILSAIIKKRQVIIMLVLYLAGIVYLTLLFRERGETGKTELLWLFRRIFIDREARSDIIKNIWLFIPLGAILYKLYPRRAIILASILLSGLIEGIQYFTGTGFCELDDIISNGLGGLIGYETGFLVKNLILCLKTRKQTYSA